MISGKWGVPDSTHNYESAVNIINKAKFVLNRVILKPIQ